MPGGRATLEVAFEGRDFMAAPRGKKTPVPVELAPVVLIKGKEGLLIDRAMATLRAQAYEQDPNLERSDVQASNYQAGHLDVLTSPSLFGEARLILIPELEQMTGALADTCPLQRPMCGSSPSTRAAMLRAKKSSKRSRKPDSPLFRPRRSRMTATSSSSSKRKSAALIAG